MRAAALIDVCGPVIVTVNVVLKIWWQLPQQRWPWFFVFVIVIMVAIIAVMVIAISVVFNVIGHRELLRTFVLLCNLIDRTARGFFHPVYLLRKAFSRTLTEHKYTPAVWCYRKWQRIFRHRHDTFRKGTLNMFETLEVWQVVTSMNSLRL